ncbi:MAG: hypothetical protein Q7J42_01325 [Sulfuritalea sp.]|nr:hypothetical protein [Sulfuritalea sp.]
MSIPGTELIDAIDLPKDSTKRRKADFLLENRRIVVELKTLTVDTSHKIDVEVEKHRQRDDFPLFYGKADFRKVMSHLSDGEQIYRRTFGAITRSVEDAVRSAEEQISHTRHVLNLQNSVGILVILNESVELLSPDVVGYKVANLMRRSRTGNSTSEKLDFAWLLFESHSLSTSSGFQAFPSMLIEGEGAINFPWFSDFHYSLHQRWAEHNGAQFVDGGSPNPEEIQFTSALGLSEPEPTHMRRQELWQRQYDAKPHLRHLSDADLLEYGKELLTRLAPHFLKGGHGFVREVVMPQMEEFTCFLQEANHRGLDLRNIPKP